MNNILLHLYNRSVNQYRKFAEKIRKSHVTATSSKRDRYKQYKLQKKAARYYQRSNKLAFQLKIAAAAGLATAVSAETNELKAQGLGPFTNVNRAQNPLRAPLQVYTENAVGHTLTDIDQDGDFDLLIGVYNDAHPNDSYIRTFKNFQTEYGAPKPVFMEVPNASMPYTVYSIYGTFFASSVDLDGDGIDELAISPRYYDPVEFLQNNNNGSGDFTLINPAGIYISPDYYTTSLVSVDIDNDGDLDIFSGSAETSGLYFWRNNGANVFTLTGHGLTGYVPGIFYSTPAFFDIDSDGDQDLFMGDENGLVHFFLNQESGGAFINPDNFVQADASPLNFMSGTDFGNFTVPRFIDLDNDGDQDMVLSKRENNFNPDNGYLHVFYNDGANNFTEATGIDNPFGGIMGPGFDLGYQSNFSFGDIDNDGDQDLMMGAYDGHTYFYENVGSDVFERRLGAANPVDFTDSFSGDTYAYPTLVDIDGDGDLDFTFGTNDSYDGLYIHLNGGTPFAPNFSSSPTTIPLTTYFSGAAIWDYLQPDFVDFDSDGDLDLITTGIYNPGGYAYMFMNNGPPAALNFSTFPSSIDGVNNYRHNVEPADIDHDGDFDLIIGNSGTGSLEISINNAGWSPIGTNPFAAFNVSPESPASRAAPEAIDWDGDGDLDLFTGGIDGHVRFLRNDNTPVIVNVGPTLTYPENSGAVSGLSVTLTDPDVVDNTNIVRAFIKMNGFVSAEDQVAFVDQFNITGTFNGTGDELTLTGSDSFANYTTAISSLTYENTSENPDVTPRVVEYQVWDSDYTNPNTYSRTINILSINDIPISVATISILSYAEDDGNVPIDPGFTATDLDNTTLQGANIRITGNYVAAEDFLRFTDQSGITGTFVAGTLSLSGSATLAQYITAIQSVGYENISNSPNTSPRTISFDVDDGTNLSLPVIKTITVSSVNDLADVVTSTSSKLYNAGSGQIFLDDLLTISDADNTTLVEATVTISTNYSAADDQLTFTSFGGITGSFSGGVLFLSGSASVADYELTLRSVMYENTNPSPTTGIRSMEILVDDGTDFSILEIIDINVVTDLPPVLSVPVASTGSFTENGGAISVEPTLVITDDTPDLQSATISISANFVAGEDLLAFTDANGITGSYDSVTGIMSLSGTSSVVNYQTALASVTFENTSENPGLGDRTISFEVFDGTNTSNLFDKIVSVVAVNDAPLLTGTASNQTHRSLTGPVIIDDQLVTSDVDDASLSGAVISVSTNYNSGEDVLAFSDQNGITGNFNAVTGTLALTGITSVADYQLALRSITYENTVTTPSSNQKAISFIVSDQTLSSSTVTRTIDITPNEVVAAAFNEQVPAKGSVTIDVLAQGTFDTADNITVTITSTPSQGAAVLNPDNTITYTANSDGFGTDSFTYELCNEWGSCGSETVNIDIFNTPPQITQAEPIATEQGQTVDQPLSSFLNISDSEDNLDLSTVRIIEQPTSMNQASIAGSNLVVDYSGSSFAGADRLTIEVCDLSGDCTEHVVVIIVGELQTVNVFNAVSPNNDGFHDFLNMQDIEFFQSNEVYIYDKNGRLVFNVTDYNNIDRVFISQDSNGNELPNGTYYYALFLTSTQGNEYKQSGYFVLQR